MSASGSDLCSDFGEMCEEFSVDSEGNPTNAPALNGDSKRSARDDDEPKQSLEERRKQKRLDKLNKKIKALGKKHDKERKISKEQPSDIRNKHKRQEVVLRKRMADRREHK